MSTVISILPAKVDYELWQGNTWEPGTITATVSGVAVNFTGYTALMAIKNANNGATALTLTNGSGITLSSVGVITLTMTAAQTATLSGEYKYGLDITDTNSKKRTYTEGTLTVNTVGIDN